MGKEVEGRKKGPAGLPGFRHREPAGPFSEARGQAGAGLWDQARAGSPSCLRDGEGTAPHTSGCREPTQQRAE